MPTSQKHADHDYILARQERYIAAYLKGSPKAMMEWMDPEDFVYSDFSTSIKNLLHYTTPLLFANNPVASKQIDMKHDQVHSLIERAFTSFSDHNIKTIALNGHRDFTAWEWEITCRAVIDAEGRRVEGGEAELRKLKGCTLQWWNERDKIVRNHDYVHVVELGFGSSVKSKL